MPRSIGQWLMLAKPDETSKFFEAHLKRGERILWQGAPDHGLGLGFIQAISLLILVSFVCVALYGLFLATPRDEQLIANLVGVTLVPIVFILVLFAPMLKRRRSLYALSTRRAFILFRWPLFKQRVYSWPITSGSRFHIVRPEPLCIYFATIPYLLVNNRNLRIGFQRIESGETVLKLMKDIRDGKFGGYSYAPSELLKAE